MTNDDRKQAKSLLAAYRAGGRPLADALGIAVSAAMAAVVSGTQRKREKIWAGLRRKGYAAARSSLKRNPARRKAGG